ncbi:LacI family DNA-binding transcriptional regulator [Leucobacter sp. GX0328]
MEDVAKRAGVSRALVSLAYRNLPGVSEATRERILAVGRELRYSPNRVAARLASSSGDTIGVFLQDLHNDLYADVFDGVREVADREGIPLVLTVGELGGNRDRSALETLKQSRVDVAIAIGLLMSDAEASEVAKDLPLVVVTRKIDGIDSVYSDDLESGRLATEYLIRMGHRRIAFLANPPDDGYRGRRDGYFAVMERAGLPPRVVQSEWSREAAARDIGEVLDSVERPTGIFAHNDQAALGVLDALAARGLRAGVDVSVIGHDNTAGSRLPGAALTTVDLHGFELGRRAAELALSRIAEPARHAEDSPSRPTLIKRETTASYVQPITGSPEASLNRG